MVRLAGSVPGMERDRSVATASRVKAGWGELVCRVADREAGTT
jgi:hypothetical protein